MDDVLRPVPAVGAAPAPPDFYPLRLILQPSGLTLELDRSDVVAGRHSGADVRLPLPDVSRRHCRFLFEEGCWHVVDLDSLNGVWVNDERVERSVLEQDDELKIGGFHFAVDLSRSVAGEEPPDVLRSILKAMPPCEPLRRAS
jgi:pSer/pThr/pTyr-binding forkhead associated (FHA) protein